MQHAKQYHATYTLFASRTHLAYHARRKQSDADARLFRLLAPQQETLNHGARTGGGTVRRERSANARLLKWWKM